MGFEWSLITTNAAHLTVPPEAKCCLCRLLVDNGCRLSGCGHSACYTCQTELGRRSPFCPLDDQPFSHSAPIGLAVETHNWLRDVRLKCRWFDGDVCTATAIALSAVHRHEDQCPNRPGLRPHTTATPSRPIGPLYACRHCHHVYSYPLIGRLCGQCGQSTTTPEMIRFPHVVLVEYVMFGTFVATITGMDVTAKGLKMKRVLKNCSNSTIRFRLAIDLHFRDMRQLYYCLSPSLPALFVRLNNEANVRLQEDLCIGDRSPNGFKFDVKSQDPREQYVIVMLKDKIVNNFAKALAECVTHERPDSDTICMALDESDSWQLLMRARSKCDSVMNSGHFYTHLI